MRLAEEAQRAADSKLERQQLRDDGSVNIDEYDAWFSLGGMHLWVSWGQNMDSEILKRQWRVIPAAYLSGFESKLPQQLRAIDRLEALRHNIPMNGKAFFFWEPLVLDMQLPRWNLWKLFFCAGPVVRSS
jgi:hypothetical protein